MSRRDGLEAWLERLRALIAPEHFALITDAELLTRYTQGDQSAFELIVRRYGRMVIRECRHLHDDNEAEDAFQAAFLALVRHAGQLCNGPPSVGGWLRIVTRNIVLNAKRRLATRNGRERPVSDLTHTADLRDQSSTLEYDIALILHAEIERLPPRYRDPLEMKHLDQVTYVEISTRLGISVQLAQCRVSRALDKLRMRLVRRGIVLPAGVLAGMLTTEAVRSEVPSALMAEAVSIAKAIVTGQTITEGIVSAKVVAAAQSAIPGAMRAKVAAAIVLIFLVAGGVGATIWGDDDSKRFQDDAPAARKPLADSNALAERTAENAKQDRRRRLLTDACVPRLIAALEDITGKAELKEAAIEDDKALVSLSWQVEFCKLQTVSFRYKVGTDELLVWRIDGDGKKFVVDPSRPIYVQLWDGGPKIVHGVAQVKEMHAAFGELRE